MGYDRIGNEYLLLKKLGEGGYATVYKVKNLEYGYIRAIRVLNTHVESEQEKVYQNFLRECKVLLRLGNGCHPNIVRLYRPRHVAGRAFVEMDWVDGEDLRQLIDRYGGKVPVEETMRMVREIGSALAYCHHDIYKVCYDRESDHLEDNDDGTALITPEIEQRLVEKYRVIHNDIHTGNIMRRRDGEYVLLDFGLAVDGDSDVVNSSRRQQGAIEFLSPERLDGLPPTPQDDIYGFGCVVYAMLTGLPPFPVRRDGKEISVKEMGRVYTAHKETLPPPIERTDVPEWLKEMTMRCLAKNPQERYADGYELYQEVLKHVAAKSTEVSARAGSEASAGLVSRVQELTEKIKDLERKLDEKPAATSELVEEKIEIEEMLEEESQATTEVSGTELLSKNNVQLGNKESGKRKWWQRKWRIVVGSVICVSIIVVCMLLWHKPIPTKDDIMPLPPITKEDYMTFTVGGESFTMVYVPGGTFMMGAQKTNSSQPNYDPLADDDECPVHSVTVDGFYMGKYEVTQRLWKAVMGNNPSRFKGDNLPVEQVSWDDAQEFIEELNRQTGRTFRLPTEAEWEYAARGGESTSLYNGENITIIGSNISPNLDLLAWYGGNCGQDYTRSAGCDEANGVDISGWLEKQYRDSRGGTHPVGAKQPNAFGLYDMLGNVWEWCSDYYGPYGSGSQRDPVGPSTGSYRVRRGGCWDSFAQYCRVSRRNYYTPSYRFNFLGFRLVFVP